MQKHEETIFYLWVKTHIEHSEYKFTETDKLYRDYVTFYFESIPQSARYTARPMAKGNWGVKLSQMYGESFHKRIDGRMVRVRELAIRQGAPPGEFKEGR